MANLDVEETVLVKFAQKLAGNEKKYRDRAVKKLRRWLKVQSQLPKGSLTRKSFLKLWKGLHYCMWMSDKPLVQEELAENIAGLLHSLNTTKQVALFVDVFFETECREWFGIDRLRLDKFMMLIRIMFREALTYLKCLKWKRSAILLFTKYLAKTCLSGQDDSVPDGIRFHMTDIYLDEINRISEGQLSSDRVQLFLEPYCVLLAVVNSKALQSLVVKNIFDPIVDWEKEKATKEPSDEANEAGEEEEDLPPRVPVNYKILADRLFDLASGPSCLSKNRKTVYNLVKKFNDLAEGILPQQQKIERLRSVDVPKSEVNQAVHQMIQFEAKLEKSTKLGKKKMKEKAKRKRQAKMDKECNQDLKREPESKKLKQATETQNLTSEEEPSANPNPDSESALEIPDVKSKKKKRKLSQSGVERDQSVAASHDSNVPSGKGVEWTSPTDLSDSVSRKKKKRKSLNTSTNTNLCSPVQNNATTATNDAAARNSEVELVTVSTNSDNLDSSSSFQTSQNSKTKKKDQKTNNSEKSKKSKTKGKGNPTEKTKSGSVIFPGGFCSDSDDESMITPNLSVQKPANKASPAEGNPLVSFTKTTKTPPAFIKRALGKARTPASEPRKPAVKLMQEQKVPGSAPGSGKKVVFEMNKNKAQDFKDSLMVSPQLPFNPMQKPEQSILKASPVVLPQSPLVRSPRKKLFKQRNKASDFF